MNKDNFKSAFITAEGWGTYSQVKKGKNLEVAIDVKSGVLNLKTIKIEKNGQPKKLDLTTSLQIQPGQPFIHVF